MNIAPDSATNAGKSRLEDNGTNVGNSPPEDIYGEGEIQFDPCKRKGIDDYHSNQKDVVRIKYLDNGPCQPCTYDCPCTQFGGKKKV